jgi:hypothetical protein
MKSFYLNQAGDLELDQFNNIKLVEDTAEVKQRNYLTLTTNQGEWFLNLNFGIPWIELLGQKNNQEDIRYEIIKALNQDDAIKSVDSVELDFNQENRYLTIYFQATLTDDTTFSQEVEVL